MNKIIKIEEKTVTIFYNEDFKDKDIPIIILNTFDEDGEKIWNLSKEYNCKEYILVTISNINWNKEMSPWYMKKLYKNDDDYSGEADKYIKQLETKIIPEIKSIVGDKEMILAGYSLAGLFAIYSLYKINIFNKIISASGSLWYPNFTDYVKENKILNKPEKIYFSLGNKESKTKNEILSKVEDNTKYLAEFYKNQGIKTIYEENEGNHFKDPELRIAKGIKSILN